MKKKIKSITFSNFIILLGIFQLLAQCQTNFIKAKNEVVLAFPHKDCILEGGQDKEDTKRDEIFYNTTLAPDEIDRLREPKVLTNWKKFDKNGEQKIKEVSKKDNLDSIHKL